MTNNNNNNKQISKKIREQLQNKNLNLEKLSEISGVPENFLEDLLSENFEKLPSYPYLRAYLLKVSQILDLNEKEIIAHFKDLAFKKSGTEDLLPFNRFIVRKNKAKIFLTLLIILFLVFLLFRVYKMVYSFEFSLEPPFENSEISVSASELKIKGRIGRDVRLIINGQKVSSNRNGYFEKEIFLVPGLNTIEFTLKKILGRDKNIIKQVFYTPYEKRD